MIKTIAAGCIGIVLVCLTSCYSGPPELIVTETYLGDDRPTPPFSGGVAFLYNNHVYLYLPSYSEPKKLTNSRFEDKSHIALSYGHDKIAFINEQGLPTIIDTSGNELEVVSVNGVVKDIGWSGDDQTLYMLVDNQIQYHGPPMDLPSIDVPNDDYEAHSFHVAQNGTYAYLYDQKPGVQDRNGSFKEIGVPGPTMYEVRTLFFGSRSRTYRFIRLSADGSKTLESLLNPIDGFFNATVILNKVLFTDVETRDFSSPSTIVGSGFALSPDGEQMLQGFKTESNISNDRFTNLFLDELPRGIGSKENLTFFTDESEKVFIDWKP